MYQIMYKILHLLRIFFKNIGYIISPIAALIGLYIGWKNNNTKERFLVKKGTNTYRLKLWFAIMCCSTVSLAMFLLRHKSSYIYSIFIPLTIPSLFFSLEGNVIGFIIILPLILSSIVQTIMVLVSLVRFIIYIIRINKPKHVIFI